MDQLAVAHRNRPTRCARHIWHHGYHSIQASWRAHMTPKIGIPLGASRTRTHTSQIHSHFTKSGWRLSAEGRSRSPTTASNAWHLPSTHTHGLRHILHKSNARHDPKHRVSHTTSRAYMRPPPRCHVRKEHYRIYPIDPGTRRVCVIVVASMET
jgi:hypothetical protein